MSGRHLRELALQLREYISQLRSIPRTDEAVNLATQEKHKTVFTHRILREANILVDRRLREDGTTARWLVTGIAGWTAAGWYSEHLEFVSGMFEGSVRFRMLLLHAFCEGDRELRGGSRGRGAEHTVSGELEYRQTVYRPPFISVFLSSRRPRHGVCARVRAWVQGD